jgi:hypothetical protein
LVFYQLIQKLDSYFVVVLGRWSIQLVFYRWVRLAYMVMDRITEHSFSYYNNCSHNFSN